MEKTQKTIQKIVAIAEQFKISPIVVFTIMKKLSEFEDRDATRH